MFRIGTVPLRYCNAMRYHSIHASCATSSITQSTPREGESRIGDKKRDTPRVRARLAASRNYALPGAPRRAFSCSVNETTAL